MLLDLVPAFKRPRAALPWRQPTCPPSLAGRLTLISAPAGFGKTTLISAWRAIAASSDLPVAWLSLDACDNDPSTFLRYLTAVLQTLVPDVGAAALAQFEALEARSDGVREGKSAGPARRR
jgi:LuxR family maltose regulon positive regulatory protein